jgi:hypothetical protein
MGLRLQEINFLKTQRLTTHTELEQGNFSDT